MSERVGAAAVAAARETIGARFSPHGRRIETGLDCAGVVLHVAGRLGIAREARGLRYTYSSDHLQKQLEGALELYGLRAVRGMARAGDVLVLGVHVRVPHLGITTGRCLIHAHAGVGRVVEAPPEPEWRLLSVWRFAAQEREIRT